MSPFVPQKRPIPRRQTLPEYSVGASGGLRWDDALREIHHGEGVSAFFSEELVEQGE